MTLQITLSEWKMMIEGEAFVQAFTKNYQGDPAYTTFIERTKNNPEDTFYRSIPKGMHRIRTGKVAILIQGNYLY